LHHISLDGVAGLRTGAGDDDEDSDDEDDDDESDKSDCDESSTSSQAEMNAWWSGLYRRRDDNNDDDDDDGNHDPLASSASRPAVPSYVSERGSGSGRASQQAKPGASQRASSVLNRSQLKAESTRSKRLSNTALESPPTAVQSLPEQNITTTTPPPPAEEMETSTTPAGMSPGAATFWFRDRSIAIHPAPRATRLPSRLRTTSSIHPPRFALNYYLANDRDIALPGSTSPSLPTSEEKAEELHGQNKAQEERLLRAKEDAALTQLGLRKPRDKMISPLGANWQAKINHEVAKGRDKYMSPDPEPWPMDRDAFARLASPMTWLNDNCVLSALGHLAHYVNSHSDRKPGEAPKQASLNSWIYTRMEGNLRLGHVFKTRGISPANFLDVDTITLPINQGGNHWVCAIIRPRRREILFMDSFGGKGAPAIATIHKFLGTYLAAKYDASEWRDVQIKIPRQTNGHDCGMFVITNCIYLSLGLDPNSYSQSELPLQRLRIAAMSINGGFHGDFDLSNI
jgi:hypothetical protein